MLQFIKTDYDTQVIKMKHKQITNFATLNVRGCNSREQLMDIAMDATKYKTKVLTISETHIPYSEDVYEIETENEHGKKMEYIFYASNKDKNHYHGIGILVNKTLNPMFKKINERISIVTIKENNTNTTVIAVYAPTNSNCDKTPQIREDFYDTLNGNIAKIPKRNFLVIAGDLNAKTGSGYVLYKECMGKYGKGKMNDSGKALLELCLKQDLVITNTLFPHRLSHRTTWTAPDRRYTTHDGTERRNPIRNQIDYVIIRNQHRHLIKDSRSYGGTQSESDHKWYYAK